MTRKLGAFLLIFALIISNLVVAMSEGEAEAWVAPVEQIVEESVEMSLSDDEYSDVSEEIVFDEGTDGHVSPEETTMTDDEAANVEAPDEASGETTVRDDVNSDVSTAGIPVIENSDEPEIVIENTSGTLQPEETSDDALVAYDEAIADPVDDAVEEVIADISDDIFIGDSDEGDDLAESAEDDYQYVETASAFASGNVALQASSSLQRPRDVDNGSYVNAYRKYLDDVSKYKGYAVLADFDLDGVPELLALSDQWSNSGTPCCYVKYSGNNFVVHEDKYVSDSKGSLYLTQENGSYVWYKSYSYSDNGLYDSSIRKLTFNSSMAPTEEIWFGLSGNSNDGTEKYQIGSNAVTKSQYEQELAKWNSLTMLCELNPNNFKYPADWENAISQNSVVSSAESTNNRIPTITVTRNAKYRVNVGTNFQILLNGYTAKSFKSSRTKFATVDSTGLVRPRAKGSTTITIKLTNGKRYKLTLNVLDPTIPTSISLNMSGTNYVKQGDTVTLTAALPQGTYSGIKWKSNHKSVATVNNGVVTFKKKGTVTITATTIRGNKKAKVTFKVAKYDAKKDLRNYGWRTVQGTTGDRKLVFRRTHTGGYMSDHKFAEGEQIFVNLTWREGGDAIAYDNGTYGYVQAKYIAW